MSIVMKKLFPIFICLFLLFISGGCSSNGAGTYEFKDEKGNLYTLVLNSNESAICTYTVYEEYGEWVQDGPIIVAHFVPPVIAWWPNGPGSMIELHSSYLLIYDGYVYANPDACKAGSTKLRLPIKKVR